MNCTFYGLNCAIWRGCFRPFLPRKRVDVQFGGRYVQFGPKLNAVLPNLVNDPRKIHEIVQTILINAAPRTIVPDQRCGRYWIWELIDRWVDKRAQIVDCALIIAVDKQY